MRTEGAGMNKTFQEYETKLTGLEIPAFTTQLTDSAFGFTDEKLTTMQVNIGYTCNLACAHCFLESSPKSTEMMSRETMEDCLFVFKENDFSVLDITGGAPELNEHFAWFIEEGAKYGQVMVRTNATLLALPGYRFLTDAFKRNKAVVIVSMPCYTKANVDLQRGTGAFESVVAGLKTLNAVGYGLDVDLELNLIHNPLDAYLPPSQSGLELDYKRVLKEEQGIVFNSLFCLTNTPSGRFRTQLDETGKLDTYLTLLYKNFNAKTLSGLMCRFQLNVDYDGRLYDCEMNHAINLQVSGPYRTIAEMKGHNVVPRQIRFNSGCYACAAGLGSSCAGTLVCA